MSQESNHVDKLPLVSVIMAVYNEENTVTSVLDNLLAGDFKEFRIEIVLVESNSTDLTRQLISRYDSHSNVRIIYQESALGKGNAVREGFKHATGDILLIQDADDEYSISDYPSLIRPIIENQTSFVLGTRHKPGEAMRVMEGEPINSKLLNTGHHFFVWFFNSLYGTKLTDPFTMFKVFRSDCLDGLHFKSNRFDFDWELVAKLCRKGYLPIEIPVSYEARGFGEGKKVRYVRDPISWILAGIRFRLEKI